MVSETLKKFGSLDILVNSAALDPKFDATASEKGIAPGAFEDYPLEDFKAAVDVNLTGMFIVTQACVKPMVEKGKGTEMRVQLKKFTTDSMLKSSSKQTKQTVVVRGFD